MHFQVQKLSGGRAAAPRPPIEEGDETNLFCGSLTSGCHQKMAASVDGSYGVRGNEQRWKPCVLQ
jgi:hypothetical protein